MSLRISNREVCTQAVLTAGQYLLTIQMGMLVVSDKELTAVCVWPAVSQGHNAALGVLECIINFIRKFAIWGGVYAFATLASACRIPTLCGDT